MSSPAGDVAEDSAAPAVAAPIDLTGVFSPDATTMLGIRDQIEQLLAAARSAPAAAPLAFATLPRFFSATRVPEFGLDPDGYVQETLTTVVEQSVRTASPRCLANMTSVLPGVMPQLAALVTALNQNMVKTESSNALSFCETQVLRMLHALVFGEPAGHNGDRSPGWASCPAGVLTTGGTLANVTAIWSARNSSLAASGDAPDLRRVGLAGALASRGMSGMAILGSAAMHYSFDKAADLLGIGTDGVLRISTDRRGRVVLSELQAALTRCERERRLVVAIVGVAGSTGSGAVDQLDDLAELAAEAEVPFHVDAAWGGPALFSARHRDRLRGIERADTVTLDGHKQLYAPVGAGVLLFRDGRRAASVQHFADYTVRNGSQDLGRFSIEGSRPGSALLLHAALHLLGRRGYEAAFDATVSRAQQMAAMVESRPEFELLTRPELNIVVYRYLPPSLRSPGGRTEAEDRWLNELNTAVHKRQRANGLAMVSRTVWRDGGWGRSPVALRAVLANPLTSAADLEAVLDEQVALGNALCGLHGSAAPT